MLSKEIADIISWLVMNRDFFEYITASHVDSREIWCGRKAATRYSKQKIYVYHYIESVRFLCCEQTPKGYQNEQRIFCDKYTNFI
jgi:hypothetical protein